MESNKLITLALAIAVICLIYIDTTASNQITQLNNSYYAQLNKNNHLENYYFNITEQQSNIISELIEENENLSQNITIQAIKINNISKQLINSEIKTVQYKYLSDKLTNEKIIKTPKYEDVIKFAREDNTKYNTGTREYDCKSFTEDFIKNSISNNLYACFAIIYFTNGDGHAVAQYNTDKGKIYIDPQSGEQIKLKKGMSYIGYTVSHWTDCIGEKSCK